jgi:predicted phosphodiesterase
MDELDLIWCLGDLAAFGPRPAECIRRVRELQEQHSEKKFKVIGGNTDRYLVTGERFPIRPVKDADAFGKLAQAWAERDATLNWNLAQMTWEDYEFLSKILHKELHTQAKDYGPVIGFHAIPGDDEAMALRPDSPDDEALDALLDREAVLAICGHTHLTMDRQLGRWRVINPGSVGLSFSQPGRAEWALVTIENGKAEVEFRAVPYDVNAVLADMQAVGHPAPAWMAGKIR